jgi:hypothetical protein
LSDRQSALGADESCRPSVSCHSVDDQSELMMLNTEAGSKQSTRGH